MSGTRRLYLHVGLPKSGTTYLQRVCSANRGQLAQCGLGYPGAGHDHFLAAQEFLAEGPPPARGAWAELVTATAAWRGDVLVSHELFCFARGPQLDRVRELAAGRPVTLVATARDLLRQLPAVWQEQTKNGATEPYAEFLGTVRRQARTGRRPGRGFWVHQDLAGILERWTERLPAETDVVVVTSPRPGAPPAELWRRFAIGIGLDPDLAVQQALPRNVSLGVVESEFVRRLNLGLAGRVSAADARAFVKRDLAQRAFAGRTDLRRLDVPAAHWPWVIEAAEQQVALLGEAGYRVVGDLADLLVTAATTGPTPYEVTDAELADRGVLALVALADRVGGRRLPLTRTGPERVLAAARRVLERADGGPDR